MTELRDGITSLHGIHVKTALWFEFTLIFFFFFFLPNSHGFRIGFGFLLQIVMVSGVNCSFLLPISHGFRIGLRFLL